MSMVFFRFRNELTINRVFFFKLSIGHEPGIALFVPDEEPLKFYRAIANMPLLPSNPEVALYFEINPIYEKETREMLEGLGFKAIDTKEDAFGKQRMMRAGKS